MFDRSNFFEIFVAGHLETISAKLFSIPTTGFKGDDFF